ncbi:hypothetical protein F2P81_025432 [Scophthalmus maximus]|uniref:Lactase-like protein n=1 Tax=Scophthalmus maximus TaxID=52904 RepID=A0A6A4RIM4_SCOMX|nr:hypothetical protein F2P81_025432 [Scophthalmus maximus]
MINFFNDFANLCFERFGNRVKNWITFNNPWSVAVEGYETGQHAPGLKLKGTGAYRAAHHIIQEKSYIKGTCDFLGLGHFTTRYVTQKNYPSGLGDSYFADRDLAELVDPQWPDPGSEWLYSVPWGFRRLLNFVKTQYRNPMVYVTENGVSEKTQCTDLCDDWRMTYLKDYVNQMLKAIRDGVNVKGYTAWSLLDNFEWDEGFSERFGLYYVDFRNKNKPRYPKASVQFYKRIISSNGFPNQREVESWKRKAVETCSSSNQLLAADPLIGHMEMVTEIVVPTVCTLCILLSAVFLMFLLRGRL